MTEHALISYIIALRVITILNDFGKTQMLKKLSHKANKQAMASNYDRL